MTPYTRPDRIECEGCGGALAAPLDIGHAVCHECRHEQGEP